MNQCDHACIPPLHSGLIGWAQAMNNTLIQLMTVNDCCKSGRFSRATFYRLAKNDPNFPKLLKIGSSTRARGDRWDAYVDSLSEQDDEAA